MQTNYYCPSLTNIRLLFATRFYAYRRGLCRRAVCPSVWVFVTFVYSVKTSKRRLILNFFHLHCKLKACNYCIYFWGPKNQLSAISPPKRSRSGPNSVYVDRSRGDNVQRIFGRDRPILGKMGAGTSPAEPEFFACGNPDDLSATLQRPIFTRFGHET